LCRAERFAEAVAVRKRAVEVYERLAAADPDAFLEKLQGSLEILVRLSDAVGRPEDGVAPARRLVEVIDRLAKVESDTDFFDPVLYRMLLVARLERLGRREELVAALQESVAACERLAEDDPDVFLPQAGYFLQELAVALGEVGRREEGMAAARRAVELLQRLAEDSPSDYQQQDAERLLVIDDREKIAKSLIVLGRLQIEDARFVEAVPCLVEAISLAEQLAEGARQLIGEAAELVRLAYERDSEGVRDTLREVTGRDVVEWLDAKSAS